MILHLIDSFHPVIGGMENSAYRLAVEQQKRGRAVAVLTRQIEVRLPQHDSLGGVSVRRVRPRGPRSYRTNWLSIPTMLAALWRNRGQIEILHVHDVRSLLLVGILAKSFLNCKVVVTVPTEGDIGSGRRPLSKFLPEWLWRWLLRRVDGWVAVSPPLVAELSALNLKAAYVPFSVDTTRFRPAAPDEKYALRERLNLPQTAYILISHGRLVRRKRPQDFAAALETLPANDWLGLLIGDAYPPHKAVEISPNDRLKILPAQANIEDFLRCADAFVMISEREGLPNALLEAMACGLPCIVTDMPSTRAIANESCAWFFPVGDVEALVGQVSDVRENPIDARTKSAEGLRRVADLSPRTIAQQHLDFYAAL